MKEFLKECWPLHLYIAAIAGIVGLMLVLDARDQSAKRLALRERCTVALSSADALDSLRVYVVQPGCVK